MVSISDLKKKYLGAPDATDEDWEIVSAVREYVDAEIMPRRKELEGGWHRDEKIARETFEKVYQGLVDIDVQRAIWPKEFGGLGVSDVANTLINEEIKINSIIIYEIIVGFLYLINRGILSIIK